MPATTDQLIINSPFEEPSEHRRCERDRKALDQWAKAVNTHGGFGEWCYAVSRSPMEVVEVLDKMSRDPGLSSIGR